MYVIMVGWLYSRMDGRIDLQIGNKFYIINLNEYK